MSADLDALRREPDDFERQMFAIEDALQLAEDIHADGRQLIRTLAHAAADADPDVAKYRGIMTPDLTYTFEDTFEFLHYMHERYVVERDAARAARELLDRREETARSGGQAA